MLKLKIFLKSAQMKIKFVLSFGTAGKQTDKCYFATINKNTFLMALNIKVIYEFFQSISMLMAIKKVPSEKLLSDLEKTLSGKNAKGKDMIIFQSVDHEFGHLAEFVKIYKKRFKEQGELIKVVDECHEKKVTMLRGVVKAIGGDFHSFPSNYAMTSTMEFVAECAANAKAPIYSKIKQLRGLKEKNVNLSSIIDFHNFKNFANDLSKGKEGENAKKALKELLTPEYVWGLAYRILENDKEYRALVKKALGLENKLEQIKSLIK